ncbi:hypothetical protein HanIR_Chr17g0858431 [Helianthus annuus]|nr:hypothetical protein HanIR_Chr17g0858431 [Helianthus annuus]
MSGLCQRWSRLETTGQIHVARLLKRPFRVGSERFIRVGMSWCLFARGASPCL